MWKGVEIRRASVAWPILRDEQVTKPEAKSPFRRDLYPLSRHPLEREKNKFRWS